MSDRITKARKGKFFQRGDIVVYAVVALLVAALFLGFFLPNKGSKLQKVEVFYGDSIIYAYDFSLQSGKKTDVSGVKIEETVNSGVTKVKICTEKGVNILEFGNGYAKMVEADCSANADCVNNFRRIKEGGDVIVCLPHRLKAVGYGESGNGVTL